MEAYSKVHPLQGAARGLAEELGIRVDASVLEGPLGPTHARELKGPDFHDRELVQSFLLRQWNPAKRLRIDPAEVSGIQWISPAKLRVAARLRPGEYTDWLRTEGASLDWLQDGLYGSSKIRSLGVK